MTTLLLAAALLATVPQDAVLRDRCDLIEVNAFHDQDAKLIFTQCLFWDWCPTRSCHRICDWKLIRQNRDQFDAKNITIKRDFSTGEWVATWSDDSGPREVRAATYRDSLTQFDPELLDRDKHPVQERRKLSSGKAVEP